MPKEVFGRDFQFLPRSELLTFEEIVRLARVFAREGVSKLRITGGEPLLRRELERLVDMLARTRPRSLLHRKLLTRGAGTRLQGERWRRR